ncbi:unnamed protein product, partial [Prorocentrum cordatum]
EVQLGELATGMLRRQDVLGYWDGRVEDSLSPEMRTLRCWGGASYLLMDRYRVNNVRSEDALRRGRFTEDVLEFFLKVLQRICGVLALPVAVASKTVGLHAGRAESAEQFRKIMGGWKKVWNRADVAGKKELVLPVAVDEKGRDWFCVSVRSASEGEVLGRAERFVVRVYDEMRRQGAARRVALNLDALVRGPASAVAGQAGPETIVEEGVPECRVSQQRCLCAFGVLLSLVSRAAGERGLDMASKTFVPDAGQAVAAVFAGFRTRLRQEGASDVSVLLVEVDACRAVLRSLGHAPSLVRRGGEAEGEGAEAAAGSVSGGRTSALERGRGDGATAGVRLRVGTWNVAGGSWSAQAPPRYGGRDQRAALVAEILGWRRAFGCDVVALQECEGAGAMGELLDQYQFLGATPAAATRGYVHLYVRRGMEAERLLCEASSAAGVAARVRVAPGQGGAAADEVFVLAVHLPAGDRAAQRAAALGEALRSLDESGAERARVLVVGDWNVRDEEVAALCEAEGMCDATCAGKTWGVRWNRFFADQQCSGPGFCFDRAMFGEKLFARAHVMARGPVVFEGVQFCASDHFGLMVYVDVADVFALRGRGRAEAARVRRGEVCRVCEVGGEREAQEVRDRRQAARDQQGLDRERAAERDREAFARGQQRAARERARRRQALHDAAFGRESLFDQDFVVEAEGLGEGVQISSPSAIVVPGAEEWQDGGWGEVAGVPVVGMGNLGNTCYVNGVLQLLLRVPSVHEVLSRHGRDQCPRALLGEDCVVCLLRETLGQVMAALRRAGVRKPRLAQERAAVGERCGDDQQWDASEFFGHWFHRARQVRKSGEGSVELDAGRCVPWGDGWLHGQDGFQVTHWDRLFRYGSAEMVCVVPPEDRGVSLTTSELYLRACGPEVQEEADRLECPRCESRQVHVLQWRVREPPTVLFARVIRPVAAGGQGVLLRRRVDVEEEIQLPGFPRMVLAGVLFHNGATVRSGHYTSMCRGPGGMFWMYDDAKVQAVQGGVGEQKPAQTCMQSDAAYECCVRA